MLTTNIFCLFLLASFFRLLFLYNANDYNTNKTENKTQKHPKHPKNMSFSTAVGSPLVHFPVFFCLK